MEGKISFGVLLTIAVTSAFVDGAAVNPCEFACPLSMVPVCGSNGVTYDNECVLREVNCKQRSFLNITVAHQGPCESDRGSATANCEFVCQLSLVPVCGSDGNTYDSECDLKRAACLRRSGEKLTKAHDGECDSAVPYITTAPCEFVCPLDLSPVCGSDGATYDSECDLKRVSCMRRSAVKLTKVHDGPCDKVARGKPCKFVCPLSLIPVCGTDGNTYPSECDLRKSACRRRALNTLSVAYKGPCVDAKPCDFVCRFSLVPVCGTDGHTYLNECDLKQTACRRRGLNKLSVAHSGPCECDLVFCRYSEEKVCGTDGNTYKNECDLKQSACRQGADISVKSDGPC